jgi:hypothetical protein
MTRKNNLVQRNLKLGKHNHEFTGYHSDVPYLHYHAKGGVIDGIGRQHINLYAKCIICDEEVLVAKMHVDKDGKIYGLDNQIV